MTGLPIVIGSISNSSSRTFQTSNEHKNVKRSNITKSCSLQNVLGCATALGTYTPPRSLSSSSSSINDIDNGNKRKKRPIGSMTALMTISYQEDTIDRLKNASSSSDDDSVKKIAKEEIRKKGKRGVVVVADVKVEIYGTMESKLYDDVNDDDEEERSHVALCSVALGTRTKGQREQLGSDNDEGVGGRGGIEEFDDEGAKDRERDVEASVSFSSDGMYLACLIPHPFKLDTPASSSHSNLSYEASYSLEKNEYQSQQRQEQQSTVVIFELKKKKKKPNGGRNRPLPPPPIPSWVTTPKTTSLTHSSEEKSLYEALPTPSNPRVVVINTSSSSTAMTQPISNVTSICDASHISSTSTSQPGGAPLMIMMMLLAGRSDGSIVAIDYESSRVMGEVILDHIVQKNHDAAAAPADSDEDEMMVNRGKDDDAAVWNGNGHAAFDMEYENDTPENYMSCEDEDQDNHQTEVIPDSANRSPFPNPILHLTHHHYQCPTTVTASPSQAYNPGQLVTIRQDGSVTLYRTSVIEFLPISSSSPPPNLRLQPTACFPASSSFIKARWIDDDSLVLLADPNHKRERRFHHSISDQYSDYPKSDTNGHRNGHVHHHTNNSTMSARVYYVGACPHLPPKIISQLDMDADKLEERSQGSFSSLTTINSRKEEQEQEQGVAWIGSSLGSICVDERTKCLGVTGWIPIVGDDDDEVEEEEKGGEARRMRGMFLKGFSAGSSSRFATATSVIDDDDDDQDEEEEEEGLYETPMPKSSHWTLKRKIRRSTQARPFACIWNWQSSILGLTLSGDVHRTKSLPSFRAPFFSRLLFSQNGQSLVHLRVNPSRVFKDVFDLGLLSPSEVDCKSGNVEANPLLLGSSTISFPFLSNPSSSQDFSIRWKQSSLPSSYTSAHGPARLAAIGRTFGRSIAVASSRGLCILDLAKVRGNNYNPSGNLGVINSGGDVTEEGQQQDFFRHRLMDKNPSGSHHFQNKKAMLTCHRPDRPLPCVSGFPCSRSSSGVPGGMRNVYPKWRQFGSEYDEKAFRVVAMTWWERDGPAGDHGEEVSEDLLLAIVKYFGDEGEEAMISPFYIVCWSRRRLGTGQYQLLEEESDGVTHNESTRRGIALPRGLFPNSISILSEPSAKKPSTRALFLISSITNEGTITYMTYQMQVEVASTASTAGSYETERPQSRVLARLCSTGRISSEDESKEVVKCGKVVEVFLAGGSFQFDLRGSDRASGLDTHDFIATLGILRKLGGGLDAVAITPSGPLLVGTAVPGDVLCRETKLDDDQPTSTLKDVVTYWISDIIQDDSFQSTSSRCSARAQAGRNSFVWTIARNDDRVFCWSVPFFNNSGEQVKVDSPNFITRTLEHVNGKVSNHSSLAPFLSKSLLPPKRIPSFLHACAAHTHPNLHLKQEYMSIALGKISCTSSTWMMGASTNGSEMSLGPLPSSCGGCVLYAGQHSRRIRKGLAAGGVSRTASTKKGSSVMNVYGVGDCIVEPPSFANSLFSSFLVAATPAFASDDVEMDSSVSLRHMDMETFSLVMMDSMAARNYAIGRLRKQNDDTTIMALRIVILLTVGYISKVKGEYKLSMSQPESQIVSFASALKSEVFMAARDVLHPLEFSSLMLGIGRQVEPQDFNNLFPLPTERVDFHDGILAMNGCSTHSSLSLSTVEDLYNLAVSYGSVSTAASALPLVNSKRASLRKCIDLLRHCLYVVGVNCKYHTKLDLDGSAEERKFLQQLYRFGLKLEDSYDFDEDEENDEETLSNGSIEFDDNFHSRSVNVLQNSQNSDGALGPLSHSSGANSSRGISRLFGMISPMLRKEKEEILDENAISKAASSFILSGFDEKEDVSQEGINGEKDDFPGDVSSVRSQSATGTSLGALINSSVAGIIMKYLFLLTLADKGGDLLCWKVSATIARLLLGDRVTSGSSAFSLESLNAFRIVQSMTEEDLAEVLVLGPDDSMKEVQENGSKGANSNENETSLRESGVTNHEIDESSIVPMILVRQIRSCSDQIQSNEASYIFELIILLLMRYERYEDVQILAPPLIAMALVTGHISGRLGELLGPLSDSTPFGRCYSTVAKHI